MCGLDKATLCEHLTDEQLEQVRAGGESAAPFLSALGAGLAAFLKALTSPVAVLFGKR